MELPPSYDYLSNSTSGADVIEVPKVSLLVNEHKVEEVIMGSQILKGMLNHFLRASSVNLNN